MLLAVGVLAALLEAKRSGRGQVVDAAMVDGAALLMAPIYAALARGRWQVERGANMLDGAAPWYDTYECADGRWVAVGPIEPQFFALVAEKLGLGDMAARFGDRMDPARWPALREAMAAVFRSKTRDDWAAVFEGTDGCVAPVLDLTEAPPTRTTRRAACSWSARARCSRRRRRASAAPPPSRACRRRSVASTRRACLPSGASTRMRSPRCGRPARFPRPLERNTASMDTVANAFPPGGLAGPRTVLNAEHEMFRDAVRRFFERHVVPHHRDWERARVVPRSLWLEAGAQGLLCPTLAEEYGGAGGDFGHSAVIIEEIARTNASGVGFPLHSDIVVPYIADLATEERKRDWLPRMARGEIIGAIAMTEPGMGSDLKAVRTTARREGGDYVIDGQKTFISNGQNAGLVIVVAKTDPAAGRKGISLICVEEGTPGFSRGRNLEKIGLHAQDTSELFFDGVRVPVGQPARGGEQGLLLPDPQPAAGAAGDRGARARWAWR